MMSTYFLIAIIVLAGCVAPLAEDASAPADEPGFDPGPVRYPDSSGMDEVRDRLLHGLQSSLRWTNGTDVEADHARFVEDARASRGDLLRVREMRGRLPQYWVAANAPISAKSEMAAIERFINEKTHEVAQMERTEGRAIAEANLALLVVGLGQTVARQPTHSGLPDEAIAVASLHLFSLGVDAAIQTPTSLEARITPACATSLVVRARTDLVMMNADRSRTVRPVLTAGADWLPAAEWSLARNFTGGAAIQALNVLNALDIAEAADSAASTTVANVSFQAAWDAAGKLTNSSVLASFYLQMADYWQTAHTLYMTQEGPSSEVARVAADGPRALTRIATVWEDARTGVDDCVRSLRDSDDRLSRSTRP